MNTKSTDRSLGITALVVLVTASAACDGNGPTSPNVLQAIEITGAPAVSAGLTTQLAARGTYSNGTHRVLTSGVRWSSDDVTVGTVSEAGLVTGEGVGTTLVRASLDGVTGAMGIEITAASLEWITILPSDGWVSVGDELQMVARGRYSDAADSALTSDVEWSSDDESVATITETGLLAGRAEGTAMITAAVGDFVRTVAVGVTAAVLESISLRPEGREIRATDDLRMVATGHYSDGTNVILDAAELTWSVMGAGAVATIDAGGALTAQGVGVATVRAERPDGLAGSVDVTVRPFASEGTFEDPVTPPSLPFRGEAGGETSHYRFGGLVPGEVYSIQVRSVHAPIGAFGYQEEGSGSAVCGRHHFSDGLSCALRAGPSGDVFLRVGAHDPDGSIDTLDVVPGGVLDEGSVEAPVDITGALPFPGVVGTGFSHYVVTGLAAGQTYTVRLAAPSDDVGIRVDDDANLVDDDECWSNEPGTSAESCTYRAGAAGELYVRVGGGGTAGGASFEIELEAGGLVNEGSIHAPMDVTAALPYSGQVGTLYSYYLLTGLVAGAVYTVSVEDVTDEVKLQVDSWPRAGYVARECTSANPGPTASESCAGVAVNGELYITVWGHPTAEGATFTLDVAPGGTPKEGYPSDPMDLTGALPHRGSANRLASYYVVGGLVPGSSVTAFLTELTDRASMTTHDSTFSNVQCRSSMLGTADESCPATADAAGRVYIRVKSDWDVSAVLYSLDVR